MNREDIIRMAREALEEAVEIIESEWPSKFVSGRKAITALSTAIEQAEKQEPVQVSPLEFVTMVMEKEELVGKPLFWAEWPNKDKNGGQA